MRELRANELTLTELNIERELMAKVTVLKLQYFGHVVRGSSRELALHLLEATVDCKRYQVKSGQDDVN